MRRIVYIQYTNPAAYPPLIHSSAILDEHGWQVLLLAIQARSASFMALMLRPGIQYQQLGAASGGPFGSVKYARYAARVLMAARRFRADWCYASDAFSAPIALACRKLLRTRVLYHEHDAPPQAVSRRQSAVMKARDRLAQSAEVVVAPAAARLDLLPVGRGQRLVVWNCPRRREVSLERTQTSTSTFRMVYHGSLSRERLTPQFIDALSLLPEAVELHVFGYETQGNQGYVEELQQRARATGVAARFFYHGVIAERSDLLGRLPDYDIGIATINANSSDPNLQTLAGASNKAFEYLSAGIPLLVSPQKEWQELFVAPGYGVTCEPTNAPSIATAVLSLVSEPERARLMGARGRLRILDDWNYDTQFGPVLAALEQ